MKYKSSSITLIYNDQGELALQQRAAHDTSYPSHWDFSAAGGIDDNEDPKDATVREVREELGIEGSPTYIGMHIYKNEFAENRLHIYNMTHNGPFSPDLNEVAEVQFFSLQKIEEMLASKEKFHPEFPFLWAKGVIN